MVFRSSAHRCGPISRIMPRALWRAVQASKFPRMHRPSKSAPPSSAFCQTRGFEPRHGDWAMRWCGTEMLWKMRCRRLSAYSDPGFRQYPILMLPVGLFRIAGARLLLLLLLLQIPDLHTDRGDRFLGRGQRPHRGPANGRKSAQPRHSYGSRRRSAIHPERTKILRP